MRTTASCRPRRWLPSHINQRQGGDGWFGTVGAGYDWQFSSSWVAGIFGRRPVRQPAGATFRTRSPALPAHEKLRDTWAAGARLGYLVAPNVLSYVNGGYTGSHWSGADLFTTVSGTASGVHTNGFTHNGWFVGGGVENNLNIFGITAPGWFMKTEYRAAYYDNKNLGEIGRRRPTRSTGRDISFKPFVQTISTSLVYRFNWGGPVVAKY